MISARTSGTVANPVGGEAPGRDHVPRLRDGGDIPRAYPAGDRGSPRPPHGQRRYWSRQSGRVSQSVARSIAEHISDDGFQHYDLRNPHERFGERLSEYRCCLAGLRHFRDG
jgi:hypothetical protein